MGRRADGGVTLDSACARPWRRAASSSPPSRSPRVIPTRSPTRSPTPSSTPSSPTTRTGRVACETLSRPGSSSSPARSRPRRTSTSRASCARRSREIGYTRAKYGFDAETCGVIVALDEQSPDIAQGVDTAYEVQHDPGDDDPLDRVGAGDQGMMFGYATERDAGADAAADHARAPASRKRLAEVRKADVLPVPAPGRQDAGDGPLRGRRATAARRPVEIERVLVSTQHREGLDSGDDDQAGPDRARAAADPAAATSTTRSASTTRTSSTSTRPASS